MEDHRNVEPAVYNSRRLIEQPVPMPTRQFNSNDAFDETFNSETSGDAETSGDVNDETTMVNHEDSSHSDLLAESQARDHINTTSDGEGIQHDTDNSIENESIENGHCNNPNVDDEEEIDPNLAIAKHDESDPLAVSVGNDLEIDLSDMIDGSGTAQNEQNQTEAISSDVGESDTRAVVSNVVAVKLEPLPVYDNHVANNNDIDDVLNEPV